LEISLYGGAGTKFHSIYNIIFGIRLLSGGGVSLSALGVATFEWVDVVHLISCRVAGVFQNLRSWGEGPDEGILAPMRLFSAGRRSSLEDPLLAIVWARMKALVPRVDELVQRHND